MSRQRNQRKKTVARNSKYPQWDYENDWIGWNRFIRIWQKIQNGNPIIKGQ